MSDIAISKTNRDLFLECKDSTLGTLDKISNNDSKNLKLTQMIDLVKNEYSECLSLSNQVLKEIESSPNSKKLKEAIESTQQRIKIDSKIIEHIGKNLLNPKSVNDESFIKELSALQFASGLVIQKEEISWSKITISEVKENKYKPNTDNYSLFFGFISIFITILILLIKTNKNKNNEKMP